MRQGRLLDLRSQARSGRRRVPCGRSRWACARRWEAALHPASGSPARRAPRHGRSVAGRPL